MIECLALNKKLKQAGDLFGAGDFKNAQADYISLLNNFPDRTDILYNLALCCIALEEIKPAQNYLEQFLEKKPAHPDALNNLGALLLKQNQYQQALQCFSAVLSFNPDHLEARNNLAASFLELGRYSHAGEQYKILLEKYPQDKDIQYGYGVALLELGKFEEAITIFTDLLQQYPEDINTKSNLAVTYLRSGNTQAAKNIFEKILVQKPDTPEIDYLYRAVSQKNIPSKPPVIYIQNLFDQYARYYEKQMTEALEYQVPQKLCDLLIKFNKINFNHILDLGCGTGLSGMAFKNFAKNTTGNLTGVDLSSKMLEAAKQKNIYDLLIQADLMDFLKDTPDQYDLVISADTFNYFGDLSLIFKYTRKVLNSQGLFLFSVESDIFDNNTDKSHQDWSLKSHGRYTHTQAYLEKLAETNDFKIITLQKTTLRKQNYLDVSGFVCLAFAL